MTKFDSSWGYPYGRRFGSKIVQASNKECDGVGVGLRYRTGSKGVTTHIETECSETSTYKIQTSGHYPKESIKQDRIFLWPLMIVVTFELKFRFTASFLSTLGKNSLVIASFFVCLYYNPCTWRALLKLAKKVK